MGIDIRVPIGFFFSIIGCILVVYGLLADRSIYRQSLGVNINLQWGAVLLIFGLGMFLLGRRGRRSDKAPREAESAEEFHDQYTSAHK